MIKVTNLTKRYGPVLAIDRLCFEVKKGEVVGFLGPNGAGKTTTMRIITGFMAPTSGAVEVAGFDVFDDPMEVKKRIGYLPETPPVYGEMRVDEYLAFVARLKQVPSADVKRSVESAIEKTNLGEVRRRLIQHLSKGFRQRVGIAQALVSNPSVLILDEPTVGLDPRQVAEMRTLIQSLRGEHTIILSTHILPEVQATCERIIIINQGRIVAEDTLEGLSSKMQKGQQKLLFRVRRPSQNLYESLRNLPGVSDVAAHETPGVFVVDAHADLDLPERLAKHIVEQNVGLVEMRTVAQDLEDIFIQLTSTQNGAGVQL